MSDEKFKSERRRNWKVWLLHLHNIIKNIGKVEQNSICIGKQSYLYLNNDKLANSHRYFIN